MSFFSIFKKNTLKETPSKFKVIVSPTVLNDISMLLARQNKTALRIVVDGFC